MGVKGNRWRGGWTPQYADNHNRIFGEKMKTIYIFDVDGTLTPSRRKMTPEFEKFFSKWAENNTFYLVSGSDLDKMKEQVPENILTLADGLFTCGGNQLWQEGSVQQWPTDWKLIYENKFDIPDDLLKYLEDTLDENEYPVKAGNHIEDRGSMVNFSIVGRKCTLQERKDYFEYDKLTGEREIISEHINSNWVNLSAVIGGQISIDIAKKGFDKSQVIFEIMHRNDLKENKNRFIFIGDRTMEGGNDYPLAKVMNEMGNCRVFQAGEPSAEDGYMRTKQILEKLSD